MYIFSALLFPALLVPSLISGPGSVVSMELFNLLSPHKKALISPSTQQREHPESENVVWGSTKRGGPKKKKKGGWGDGGGGGWMS